MAIFLTELKLIPSLFWSVFVQIKWEIKSHMKCNSYNLSLIKWSLSLCNQKASWMDCSQNNIKRRRSVKTSNDYHFEVKFEYGFIKCFMMSLLFENCNIVGISIADIFKANVYIFPHPLPGFELGTVHSDDLETKCWCFRLLSYDCHIIAYK